MARLPRATYALMVSLLPATATVIGVVVLAQVPQRRRDRRRRAGHRRRRAAPRDAGPQPYASAARTSSSCVFGETFGNTWVTLPFSSITNVARAMPMYLRPYIDFSTHTP